MVEIENKKVVKTKKPLSAKTKRHIGGFLLFLPWLIGFMIFFLVPFIMLIVYSFNSISFASEGGLVLTKVGGKNYWYVFNRLLVPNTKLTFNQYLVEAIALTIIQLPLITVFSLLIAVLLNQNFKGRGLARAIFFLPIIFGLPSVIGGFSSNSGIVDVVDSRVFHFLNIEKLFQHSIIPNTIISVIAKSVKGILSILMLSGVQILIFLSALQSINTTLYEVAEIEGATKYEQFFKVTLPSIFPMLSAVIVYTLIDLLYRSPLVSLIMDSSLNTERRSVISVVFTLTTLGLLFIVFIFLKLASPDKMKKKGRKKL